MDLIDLALVAFNEEYNQWGVDVAQHTVAICRNGRIIKEGNSNLLPEFEEEMIKRAIKNAMKKAILVISSTQFPSYIHEQVEVEIPWTRLLDSADGIEGRPMEAVVKAYLRAFLADEH
jgi:hypothetical protein